MARISLFLSLALFAGGVLFFAPHVLAQTDQAAQVAQTAGLGDADLPTVIGRIISVALGLLGVLFLILIIYAGFLWMTAGGDDKKVEKAKRIFIQASVGVVIVLGSYGITTFIINALGGATGFGNGSGSGNNGSVSTEPLSGALGAGPVRDHYPQRNQTDVPRNAKVMVTFKEAIDPSTITTDSVKIYPTANGVTGSLTNVTISSTEDHKTFVFKFAEYLGSATARAQYTVTLGTDIKNASGAKIFSGSYSNGYKWSFETGTVLDLTPPTLESITPSSGETYSRNIAVQATFSEAVDPTSASGVATTTGGFSNIKIFSGATTVAGTYEISNGYTSVTFVSDDPCGTNSCGETLLCLPGPSTINVAMTGATTSTNPPQADAFPYNGIVDMAGNSFDADHDGDGGDAYTLSFSTTGDIALAGPSILAIAPNISEEKVPLDQPVTVTFDDVLMTSSVSQDTIALSNTEAASHTAHEMWFSPRVSYLNAEGNAVNTSTDVPSGTLVTVSHGTFLESTDGKSYLYGVNVTSGLKNQYQNCYVPGNGPDEANGTCGVTSTQPYCCNGVPSATACTLF